MARFAQLTLLGLLIATVIVSTVIAAPPNARIVTLPGLKTPPTFNQYSGYITVNQSADRNLFYWFLEAQTVTPTTPVVLWMNGGPGCSSLFGFWTEHGAFVVNDDGQTVQPNPYSWNREAHMLYLEAPAGVGFSYSGNGNYTTGDDVNSADNYQFLLGFFDVCVHCLLWSLWVWLTISRWARRTLNIAPIRSSSRANPTLVIMFLRSGLSESMYHLWW
jgi:hypothetical protein